tara:strand:- start:1707 stop:2210 length:504 start_codon:yes stop_codon:yes gene_type:complete
MSDKTNFQKIIDFHHEFGLDSHTTPNPNVYTENPKLVKLRWDLISEEVDELKQALDEHDFVETVDALTDILYVVYGAATSFGVDIDKAYDIVHKSNMSKLCETEELAQKTVEQYRKWFKEGKTPYDTPTYRKSPSDKYWVVFNESTGKILKSIEYTPANFDELLRHT